MAEDPSTTREVERFLLIVERLCGKTSYQAMEGEGFDCEDHITPYNRHYITE
jgi:hypothetical protein